MKRIATLALSLIAAVAVLAASATAAPAPKATGDFGFTYGGVQRHVAFAAIQSSTDTCGVFWDVSDVDQFTMNYLGLPYTHHATLHQTGESLTGDGGYPLAGPDQYHWNITSGSIVGNTLALSMTYDLGAPGVVMTMTGTVAAGGSISGTWSDNAGAGGATRSGTFTMPAATKEVSYCGKGTFSYSDEQGSWYFGVVKTVSVANDDAWYAVQILASNLGFESSAATNGLFVKVTDVGEPGIGHDLIYVGNVSSVDAATTAVAGHLDGLFLGSVAITSGNIQVH